MNPMYFCCTCSFLAIFHLFLSAKRLEIHVGYDTGLQTGRSLNPDDFLIKEKHLKNWLLRRQTNLLRKDHLIPSNGKCVIQVQLLHYVLSLFLLWSKEQWYLETLRVYCALCSACTCGRHYHTCLKRLTENFRLLMAGALGEMCSSSGISWGQPSPCSWSPGLCASHSGDAKIKHSAAECQNPGHL